MQLNSSTHFICTIVYYISLWYMVDTLFFCGLLRAIFWKILFNFSDGWNSLVDFPWTVSIWKSTHSVSHVPNISSSHKNLIDFSFNWNWYETSVVLLTKSSQLCLYPGRVFRKCSSSFASSYMEKKVPVLISLMNFHWLHQKCSTSNLMHWLHSFAE